jgi:molybdenum cofactor cytidylyltransferase
MRLRDALHIQRGDVVAFVGAGGKTSALFRLAEELRADGWRVLATTTARLASHEIQRAPLAARLTSGIMPLMIREWLDEHGFVLLYTYEDAEQREIAGLGSGMIAELVDSVNSDVLLIEADGACSLPLKAPYDHEPVIPPDTSLVVPVAGIDVLGQPLDDAHVYNAARIQARYGFPEGGEILPAWVAVTMRDPQLGLRGVPESARVVALLNKVPANRYYRRRARRVAQLVLRSPRIDAVALGAMQDAEPVYELQRRVAAVVLAAGLSSRMGGQSKALLPWGSRRTVIEAIVTRLLAARIPEVIVVTGYRGDDVKRVLANLPVQVVYNPDYARGEMLSSLQMGLRFMPDSMAACLVVMGDQPFLDGRVVGHVLAAYAEGQGEIAVPVCRGERGHPVLIDRRFWPELLALESGAPRDVICRYPEQTALVEVHTDSILRDIDTPEQYHRERFLAGLR